MKVWQRPVVAVPLAMAVLTAGGGVLYEVGKAVIADDRTCRDLDTYLGGSIPAGAADFRCVDSGFQERWYELSFRLRSGRVGELRAAFPHVSPRPAEKCRVALSLSSEPYVDWPPGMAGEFDLWAADQGDGTVLVEIRAHGG